MYRGVCKATRYGQRKNSRERERLMKFVFNKFVLGIVVIAALLTVDAWAQGDAAALERVLNQMDAAAKIFRTAQANVLWNRYDSVVKETETQKGKVYFRREGGEIQMAAD